MRESPAPAPTRRAMSRLLTLACLLLAVPVLGVLGSWAALDAASLAVLRHQLDTVLPEYALNSLPWKPKWRRPVWSRSPRR